MKRLILLYILVFSIVQADYLTTNGEIALFYDNKINRLKYVRGDIFQLIDISQMGIYFKKNNEMYSMEAGSYKVIAENSNLLKIEYLIDGNKVTTHIFPSVSDKRVLYMMTDTSNLNWKGDFQIIYMISPSSESVDIEFDGMYYYFGDTTSFNSINNTGLLFIAKPVEFLKFNMTPVNEKIRKNTGQRLYFFTEVKDKMQGDKLVFNFKHKNVVDYTEDNNRFLKEQHIFWNDFTKNFLGMKSLTIKELEFLKMISENNVIPQSIAYNKSLPSFQDRLRIAYILSVYGENDLVNKVVQDISSERKNNLENIEYYLYLFKIINTGKLKIEKDVFTEVIQPNIDNSLKELLENKDRIETESDLENAYTLWRFLNIYKNFVQNETSLNYMRFHFEHIGIEIKNTILRLPGGFDNLKSIKYLEILPSNERIKILEKMYINYYDKKIGVLKSSENSEIDLENNLEYTLKLYENGMTRKGDILFSRLEELIKGNKGYIVPKLQIEDENFIGIYTYPLYLYLKIVQYRGMQ
ncbi:hypothetical protein H3N56_04585 [Cetobacterium sp. 2A]|uniref:hypothetical protein n=1 Tax=Cetobacterium sp. 2A TaxID=2754723 RepID=UPI00163D0C7D|nr:hypothetical protein [Cetobacterium sp. 2A]MBC2855776.1 hypothetical protein [Cetobacterium sp. 2A]